MCHCIIRNCKTNGGGNAEKAKDNLQKLLNWREERLKKSKEVAREVYNKVIAEFKLKKETLIEYEQNISAKDMASVKVKLENIDREAKIRLKEHISGLSSLIAAKYLGYEVQIESVDEDVVNNILNTDVEEGSNGN